MPHVPTLRRLALACVLILLGSAARADHAPPLSFDSVVLGRPLTYHVVRPPAGVGPGPYPTITLLHGYGGSGHDWVHAAGVRSAAHRLMREGAMPPAVLVLPSAGNSWYVDDPAPGGTGRIATALREELPGDLARRFDVCSGPRARAIGGVSMGGFGALRFAFMAPQHYAAVAALSPAIFPTAAAAQAGDMQLALYGGVFGRPFDPARFEALHVWAYLDRLAGASRRPAIWLAVGDDDYFGLWRGTLALFRDLRERGVPAELRVRDGGHTWPFWSALLPEMLRHLGADLTCGEPD